MARSDQRVAEIMDTQPVFIRAGDSRAEAAEKIARYDLLALPVIDGGEKLVGIVTQDDAIDVQQEEATTDFHKVGTVSGLKAGVRDASIAAPASSGWCCSSSATSSRARASPVSRIRSRPIWRWSSSCRC